MGLGTTTGTAAIIRSAVIRRAGHLDTVFFTVVQVGTTVLDLRVPIVNFVQSDVVLFGELDATVAARNWFIVSLDELQ